MAKRIETSTYMWECEHCGKKHESEKMAQRCEAAFERSRLFKAMFVPDMLYWYKFMHKDIHTSNFGMNEQTDTIWILGYDLSQRTHYENDYPYAPKDSCMQKYSTIYNANAGRDVIDYLYQPIEHIPLLEGFTQKGLFPDMPYIKDKTYKYFTTNQKLQIKEFWLEVQKFVDSQVREFTLERLKNLCVANILQSYIKQNNRTKPTVALPQYFWENAMNWSFQFPEE